MSAEAKTSPGSVRPGPRSGLGSGVARPSSPEFSFAQILPVVGFEAGVPVIPDIGVPFVIGRTPESHIRLGGSSVSGANAVSATIYHTSQGWIVVDGTLNPEGTMTPSAHGLFVNGRRVSGYEAIVANDVIQIPDVSGNPSAGDSFVFVDPLETGVRAPVPGELELGESWLTRLESDGQIVAFASFRGLIDKYDENQDRAFYRVRPDGGVVAGVADGMGGHASGERSAEIGRAAFGLAIDSGMSLEEAVEAMHNDIHQSNRARREVGGAVFAGFHLHPDGQIEARTVGDAEVIVISHPFCTPSDFTGPFRLDYWSTRPTYNQAKEYDIPRLPDGRVALGHERTLRLAPESNIVDKALGLHSGSMRRYQSEDWIRTETGRIYFAIAASDGLTEQYASHEEMVGVVEAHIRRTESLSPESARDALMRDALLRCALARRAHRESRPFAITRPVFRDVYREMTQEMDGEASDPESGLDWPYLSRPGSNGRMEHFFMVPSGGTAYLVKGVAVPGQGAIPDPAVASPVTGRMIAENPALQDHPSLVGRFKQDNISVVVVGFARDK